MKIARNPHTEALRAAIQVLGAVVAALEAEPDVGGSDYVDQRNSPLGKRRFLTAAARGDFPTFKTGKLVLAKRSDFEAWLARSRRIAAPKKAPASPPASGGDEDALRSKLGLRLVGGAQ